MPWAVAAAAVGAAGTYAASENAKKGAQGPPSLKKGRKIAMQRATEIADRPYESYDGTRIAGISGNEQRASALARSTSTDVQRDMDASRDAMRRSELEFNEENLNRYMNPYLDTAYSAQNDAYDKQSASLLNSKAGAWGGDRVAFEKSELDKTHRDSLAKISYDAYNAASNNFFQDADRHQRAAQAWRDSAGDTTQMNRQQIQDLMATGGLERVLQQAQLDFDYSQFIEERDWDITNLQPLLQAIGVNNNAPGKPDNSDSIAAALGAGASIAGAYFGSGGGGGTNTSFGGNTPSNTPGDAGFVGPTRT
jgi:hypothetical protein